MGSFNAANTLLQHNLACAGSVVLSTPWGLTANPAMVRELGRNGDTLCIFMGLWHPEEYVSLLEEAYGADAPVTLVYRAGYHAGGSVVNTTVGELPATVEREQERLLGLIYVGPCLQTEERWHCARRSRN